MGRAFCNPNSAPYDFEMKFVETLLPGVYVIYPEFHSDERGLFVRTFCREEFVLRGLNPSVVQCSTSWNRVRGTVRGMHYQVPPHSEYKLVRCTRGRLYDVVLDLRSSSPTYGEWIGYELDPESRAAVYVPPGCAHGYQTLEDGTEVFYQMSEAYCPSHATGVRWDDPAFGITWPLPVSVISERDRLWPDYRWELRLP